MLSCIYFSRFWNRMHNCCIYVVNLLFIRC